MLAKCDVRGNEPELYTTFQERMQAAYVQQMAEGKKALWYLVDYEPELNGQGVNGQGLNI